MEDTGAVRTKMLALWTKFDNGKLSANEARTILGLRGLFSKRLKLKLLRLICLTLVCLS